MAQSASGKQQEGIEASPSDETVIKRRGYKVQELIGKGAYAQVYKLIKQNGGKESDPGAYLACKVVDTAKAPKEYVQKFLPRELDILGKVCHPHVIHIFCIIQRSYKFYIFMRYAERGDLLEYLWENGELNERQARIWFKQLVLAIEYLHEIDIAHRDIKCENILVTNNYNLKIADFGFARFTVDFQGKTKLSQTFCGSLGYAPPEILKGKAYNPKTGDVWSLGVVLFVMVNKSMPFHGHSIKILYEQQHAQKWRINPRVEKKLSKEVQNVFIKMMQPNPKLRLKINEVLRLPWFVDYKINVMTSQEAGALQQAIETKEMLRPGKKDQRLNITSNDEETVIIKLSERTPTSMEMLKSTLAKENFESRISHGDIGKQEAARNDDTSMQQQDVTAFETISKDDTLE